MRVLKKVGGRDLIGIVFLSEAKELRCFAPLSMTTIRRMELLNALLVWGVEKREVCPPLNIFFDHSLHVLFINAQNIYCA